MADPNHGEDDELIVRLRGLPYSATAQDILKLLHDCSIVGGENGIVFTFSEDGRPTGEAYVDLASEDDVSKSLEHNKEHMGRRYVEIFRASRSEKEWDLKVSHEAGCEGGGGEHVVRLRGLPYGSSEDDIKEFFSGVPIVPGSLVIQTDENGRETGIAFVEFPTEQAAEDALTRDRNTIGHRYIEVFRSTANDIRPVKPSYRPTPYDRPRDRGYQGGYGGYSSRDYDEGYSGRPHRNQRTYTGERYGRDRYESHGYNEGGYGGYRQRPRTGASYSYQRNTGGYSAQSKEPPSGQGWDYTLRMRGVPYSTSEKDIQEFFYPIRPVKMDIELDNQDRPSGLVYVAFSNERDAEEAMKNDRKNLGHRYIELFRVYEQQWGGSQDHYDRYSSGGYSRGGDDWQGVGY